MKTIDLLLVAVLFGLPPAAATARLRVVTTTSDYAWAARVVAGDHATVEAILPPDQDAHTLAPRPSYAVKVGRADLFVVNGLDLETWAPVLVAKSGNSRVAEGAPGWVRAADGVHLLGVPASLDRALGDVHAFGNPHIHTSVVNMRVVLRNIAAALARVDPENAAAYTKAATEAIADLDRRTFGPELTRAIGGDLAAQLASKGKLFAFLKDEVHEGRPLEDLLGGWLLRLQRVRDAPIATYHQNWDYLAQLAGIRVVAIAEPRPGIPPTATHVAQMARDVQRTGARILLAARHYPRSRVEAVAEKAGLTPVIVPFHVGSDGTTTYPELVERWVQALERARP